MATSQIDPKTGKNLVTGDNRAAERIVRPNTEKPSENSDSNICLQLASQLVAFLNGSGSDIASKQPESFQKNLDASICLQLTTQLAAFLNDSPCDVTFKQQEPVIAIVASLLLLLREKQRKNASVSSVSQMTTVTPSSVPTNIFEKNSSALPKTDCEILKANPTAGENLYTTLQNDISSNEETSDKSSFSPNENHEDKKDTEELQENKIFLKYSYIDGEDQTGVSQRSSVDNQENSDSNICVPSDTQLSAVLNDSCTDFAFKQPEPVKIDTMCSQEHEELRVQETPVGKIKKTKKKKDLNKQSESKKGGKMDAFLDTKEDAALCLVSPPPPMTAAAPTCVPILVSEKNPCPELIMGGENLNSIPMLEENPYTTPQTVISPWESNSEASSVSINTDRPQQNKIVLKYSYKEDQWSPLNPEGKKHYDREFLLYLQSQPLSLCKPNNLPNLSVIKDKPVIGGSQGKKGKKSKKIKSLSVDQIIELHKSPNPWRPLHKCEAPLHEKDRLKRSVLSVLNKLTPQKFETLLAQLKSLLIDTEEKLSLVSVLVFEKAVCEPMFSGVYANLSKHLALIKVPVSGASGTQVNFLKLLLTKCQMEFEQDWSHELEEKMKNLKAADPNQRKRLQFEYDEEEKKIRHRKLGNIRFIGELFKLGMLIKPILHEMIEMLLHQGNDESLEYLTRLLKTIGKELDDAKSTKKRHQMDKYFDQMKLIVAKRMTSSRVRFLLQDVIDLRKNNWLPRRPEINPKTIEEIHKEAELEAREQELCKDVTNKRKNTSEIDSFDDSRTSSESNKNSNLMVNPSKLKSTKPDEVESIRLGPVGRCLQTFEGDISSAIITTDSDKTALMNKYPNLVKQSPSSNFEEKIASQRLTLSSSESNEVFNRECLPAIRKTPSSSKERENVLETANWRSGTSEAKAPEVKSTAEIQVIGNAATTKGTENVVNRFLIYELALNSPQYNKDDMQRKTTTIIEKLILNNDFEEAIKNVTELASPNTVHMFIDAAINQVLEKSIQARYSLGHLLSSLLKKEIITFEQYKKGFSAVLERVNDYAMDISLICDYMGEILGHMIEDTETPFKLLKEVLQPCIPSEKAGILVSSILHYAAKRKSKIKIGDLWKKSDVQWTDIIGTDENIAEFIKKHKLEFTVSSTEVNPLTQMSMNEMKTQLLSQIEKNAELKVVFNWVDVNVSDTSDPIFVHALVTVVHESCLSGSETIWELNTSKLKLRVPLISRYVSTNEKLQLHVLYAVQALMNQLGQPNGLLHQIFYILYDDDVISRKIFEEWEQSDDPNEVEGKVIAVHSAKSFFTWLRKPEEETEEINFV
ncbi:unnamed protein product [Larinioides sclopetarius]|uniref:Eukaryotic translation initiation factor 4 gamma 3 n=1 Tax=Larinioides sclopetarius TaxID=280406 RepID=A0AAV1ZAI5_9ARAC